MEDISYYGLTNPGSRIAIVAPTYKSCRDTIIEGESGLLSVLPDSIVGDGWNRSLGELKLKNGTIYSLYTAEKPDLLRGPQHHRALCDELAQFGGDAQYIWDMLQMGLRLGKHPQTIITTTPLPIPLIKSLISDPKTHVVSGSTFENSDNLSDNFINILRSKYEGTRLGLQELYAQILDDVPGALWQRAWITSNRLQTGETPDEVAKRCVRIVVAIDPATTSTKESDLTGIIAAGIDEKGHGYILADETCKESPKDWASKALRLLDRFHGDRIVAEVNNGGDMVVETIWSVDDTAPVKKVSASRGKYVRAEPIASLYEQNRISHVGVFNLLEDEMCTFTPENILKNSPNRVDASVWSLTDLFSGNSTYGALEFLKSEQAMGKVSEADMVGQRMAKIFMSSMTKPMVDASTQSCPECKSKCITRIASEFRCGQCGCQFGSGKDLKKSEYVQPGARAFYFGN